MEKILRKYNLAALLLVFIALPLAFWAIDNSSNRGLLKEAISVLTIVSFSMMLMQLFLARSNKKVLMAHKMSKVVLVHKIIGYVFVPILLVHPFLIVVPRYFESGVDPIEALTTIITSLGNDGVVLGMVAWGLMLILGLSSFFRNNLGMSYKTWRVFHGVLSIVFVILASWHVIDLGRHSNIWMTTFIITLAFIGVVLLSKAYFFKSSKKTGGQTNEQ